MVNIYGMGIMPTNLSKNKYTIANKMSNNKSKPNSSLIKRNIIKSHYTTNRKIRLSKNITFVNKTNKLSHHNEEKPNYFIFGGDAERFIITSLHSFDKYKIIFK